LQKKLLYLVKMYLKVITTNLQKIAKQLLKKNHLLF